MGGHSGGGGRSGRGGGGAGGPVGSTEDRTAIQTEYKSAQKAAQELYLARQNPGLSPSLRVMDNGVTERLRKANEARKDWNKKHPDEKISMI